MLSGDNGLLKKAGNARDETIVVQEKEQVELAYVSAAVNKLNGDVEEEDLRIELNNSVGTGKTTVSTNSDSSLKVKFEDTKNEYTVSQNGNVARYEVKFSGLTNEEKAKLPTDVTEIAYKDITNENLKNIDKIKAVITGEVPITTEMTYVTGTKDT